MCVNVHARGARSKNFLLCLLCQARCVVSCLVPHVCCFFWKGLLDNWSKGERCTSVFLAGLTRRTIQHKGGAQSTTFPNVQCRLCNGRWWVVDMAKFSVIRFIKLHAMQVEQYAAYAGDTSTCACRTITHVTVGTYIVSTAVCQMFTGCMWRKQIRRSHARHGEHASVHDSTSCFQQGTHHAKLLGLMEYLHRLL